MTEDDFAKACPVCQVNCNCKSCLRLEVLVKVSFFISSHFSYWFMYFRCLVIDIKSRYFLLGVVVGQGKVQIEIQ